MRGYSVTDYCCNVQTALRKIDRSNLSDQEWRELFIAGGRVSDAVTLASNGWDAAALKIAEKIAEDYGLVF